MCTHIFLELLRELIGAVVIDTGTDDTALSLRLSSELRSKHRAFTGCIDTGIRYQPGTQLIMPVNVSLQASDMTRH